MRHCAWILLSALMAAPLAAQSGRPNIVFIFSDDHAPTAIGAYGGRLAELDPTPNLDALAAQGMRFEQSFCTNSICGPSRAVILTGKHSHQNGFRANGDRFDGGQVTFPKLLQEAGYRTALFGKWHLGSDPQGFDEWQILPGQGQYYNPVFVGPDGSHREQGYCTDLVTDKAIAWMEKQQGGGKPFLLMCQQKAPHRNWMPPLRHLRLYQDVKIPESEDLFDDLVGRAGPAQRAQMSIAEDLNPVYDLFLDPTDGWDPKAGYANDPSGFHNLGDMTPEQRRAWDEAFAADNQKFVDAHLKGPELVRWKYQRYMKNYLRTVRGLDDSIGRLMRFLEESGLADNTIVVYSSDQGFFLGEHGWYDKRWMYEPSLRMPLIVRWPGVVSAAAVDHHLVQNLDYAPTLLEAAGVEVPVDMQGQSLLPLLRGKEVPQWRQAIYYHYYGFPDIHNVARHYGIRTARHKLIHYYQTGEWELFDLLRDPHEAHNRYRDPAYREVAMDLARRLGALQNYYQDDSMEWAVRPQRRPPDSKFPLPLPARVLILGDSISIGYTNMVREQLGERAIVHRPMIKPGRAENCQGTNYGVKRLEEWLAIDGGDWDVIHFNFGLHDLKRVQPDSGKNSNDPKHPHQADPRRYRRQLDQITQRLVATGARVVFATTTPVPDAEVRPYREPADAIEYNRIAREVMAAHGVPINDLHAFALPQLDVIQPPRDVHFTKEGSALLADRVVAAIEMVAGWQR